jgi:hypothetical protein
MGAKTMGAKTMGTKTMGTKTMDTKNRLVVVVIMPPCPSPPLFTRAMHTRRPLEVFWVSLVPQFDYKLNATKLKTTSAYAKLLPNRS